jgi:type II secretory pathway pseudopilin PulG
MRAPDRFVQNRFVEYFMATALIALATASSFIFLGSALADARDSTRMSDISAIRSSLELYYIDHGAYPDVAFANSAADSWGALEETVRPYGGGLPRDPLNERGESVERAGTFNYSYYGIGDRIDGKDAKGPRDYALVFRLEKPDQLPKYEKAPGGVKTLRGTFVPLALADVPGIVIVTAP